MTTSNSPSHPHGTLRTQPRATGGIVDTALLTVALIFVLFGDVLAFNQLATQSPTDAMVQLAVFSIGGAGVVEGLRRLLTPTLNRSRRSAIFPFLLGIASLVCWRLQAPTLWLVVLAAVASIACGILAFRTLWGASRSNSPAIELFGLLCLAQTLAFSYLTVLTAIDIAPSVVR